jgi:hypothetical protein
MAEYKTPTREQRMVIVAGHRIVDPPQRESYMADCVGVVEQARRAPGCLDFSIAADLVVPGRINIFEGPPLRRGRPHPREGRRHRLTT